MDEPNLFKSLAAVSDSIDLVNIKDREDKNPKLKVKTDKPKKPTVNKNKGKTTDKPKTTTKDKINNKPNTPKKTNNN